jgi:hypothetical protein
MFGPPFGPVINYLLAQKKNSGQPSFQALGYYV